MDDGDDPVQGDELMARHAEVVEDLRATIRDANIRMDRFVDDLIAELRGVGVERRNRREEQRARIQALQRTIDRLDEGGSTASA